MSNLERLTANNAALEKILDKVLEYNENLAVFNPERDILSTCQMSIVENQGENWKIKLLTSGDITFKVNPGLIDIFCVGGGCSGGTGGGSSGGSGGNGGQTKTYYSAALSIGSSHTVEIGAGGVGSSSAAFQTGGKTWISNENQYYANGGITAVTGSGGGAGGNKNNAGAGGSDGNNGGGGTTGAAGKAGQGTTTREFGENTGELYSGGGGGGTWNAKDTNGKYGAGGEGGGGNGGQDSAGKNGVTNTGGGGGGAGYGGNSNGIQNNNAATRVPGSGGSGIIIIRNHRTS